MEIFLMVLALSLAGVLVSGVLFAAANRGVQPGAPPVLVPAAAAGEERFFMMRPAARRVAPAPYLPSDVLALQIERHVRLEQAAAERFHEFPSVEALHMPTLSPLAG